MYTKKWIQNALMASLLIMVSAMAARAQTNRAFLSSAGSDGNNVTNCQLSAPCRTFNAAIPVVNPGGELILLDSNGYGGIANINKAITIQANPGVQAFIIVLANSSGIIVNGGANDLIRLKNLHVNGMNLGNNTGLTHNGGKLIVQNCVFENLNIGVNNFAKMDLIDSDLHGNGIAAQSTGQGRDFPGNGSFSGPTQLRIAGGNITFNTVGTHQVNAGQSPSMQPLLNIWLFVHGNNSNTNQGGNTSNFTCAGAGCLAQPGNYNLVNNLN